MTNEAVDYPERDLLFATPVEGQKDRWIVDLACGHKKAVRERKAAYVCRECPKEPRQGASGVLGMTDVDQPIRCSFCAKDRGACKSLVSGPGDVYICGECIELCSDICGEHEAESVLRARVVELEAECSRMRPIYEAHLAAERRAAEHREREQQRIAGLSKHDLHREERHPDYEYRTTENARKQPGGEPPENEGWEPNDIIEDHIYRDGVVVEERWRNWTRGDFTETNYWRRKKRS